MSTKAIAVLLAGTLIAVAARAHDDSDSPPLPRNATFTTLIVTPLAIEGLTGDSCAGVAAQ